MLTYISIAHTNLVIDTVRVDVTTGKLAPLLDLSEVGTILWFVYMLHKSGSDALVDQLC